MVKKSKKNVVARLPREIRNELRMTCAMKGFSELRSGKPRRLNEQHIFMSKFYHGHPPNQPSQIRLLSEGRAAYRDLFEEDIVKTTKKNADIDSVRVLRLKHVLCGCRGTSYHSASDINWQDLEKKNRTGSLIIGGRNLHDLAARGMRCLKKALAFASEKWDDKSLEPKGSGSSIEDVIEYVRKKMYHELVGPKDKEGSDEESESEQVVVSTVEGKDTTEADGETGVVKEKATKKRCKK